MPISRVRNSSRLLRVRRCSNTCSLATTQPVDTIAICDECAPYSPPTQTISSMRLHATFQQEHASPDLLVGSYCGSSCQHQSMVPNCFVQHWRVVSALRRASSSLPKRTTATTFD